MANAITLFKKYIDALDEVYKLSALTADFDSDASLFRQGANTNELIIQKLDMDGLADYSRNSGYVDGSVTLTNETVKFNFDRGRKFSVDAMDNEETAGLAFGRLASEFVRTKVVPDLDASRFATYAGHSRYFQGHAGGLDWLTYNEPMEYDECTVCKRLVVSPFLHMRRFVTALFPLAGNHCKPTVSYMTGTGDRSIDSH